MFTIMLLNFIYAILGIVLSIAVSVFTVRLFDNMTAYDTSAELESGNRAVGMVVASIYIGTALLVGLIVGLGLN